MTETETTTAAATAAIPAATVARRPRHVGNFVRGIGMFIALPLMAICNYTSYKAVFAADPPQAGDTPSQETETTD